jgi:hypothetical protein
MYLYIPKTIPLDGRIIFYELPMAELCAFFSNNCWAVIKIAIDISPIGREKWPKNMSGHTVIAANMFTLNIIMKVI